MSLSELMIDIPTEHERNIFGQFDAYAKKIERTFHVTLILRDGTVKILGEQTYAERARRVLVQLTELSARGNTITEQNVDYAISLVFEDNEEELVAIDKELICHTLQADQAEDARTENICGCNPKKYDHVRIGTCRNRKNLSGNGDGYYRI